MFWVTHSTYLPLWDFMRATNASVTSEAAEAITKQNAGATRGWAGKAGAEAWFDDGACNGHDWHDKLPFEALWEGDQAGVLYTNQQLMEAFHPANVRGTYVYDYSFAHCTVDGE